MNYLFDTVVELLYLLPVILISLPVHEIAHGYVALKMGDDTARRAGRLTLNPAAHFDLWGTLMIILFRFGWARPVPINPFHFKKRRLGIVLVSLAGPLSNFLLALVTMVIHKLLWLLAMHVELTYQLENLFSILFTFTSLFMHINLSWALFNLLPISPLDGSKLVVAFLPARARDWILQRERYGMIVLLVLFLLDDYVLPGLVSIPMTLGVSGLLRLLDTLTFFLG
ncbi:MAG: site-2 protease family protein [Clostridia bacterium]|nr:site-2 protease family protein [Clostridia bacterium]